MKIIVTTNNKSLHCLPVFCYLFNEFWGNHQEVEIVGYEKPRFGLPPNFSFYSMGQQTDRKSDFSNDLKKYFAQQPEKFIWLLEDYFIRERVHLDKVQYLYDAMHAGSDIGRANITKECVKQDHQLAWVTTNGWSVYENTQTAKYRLSTQASIWNREFLLSYLKPDLDPWQFETQPSVNDGWRIVGMGDEAPVKHNEGVRKWDLHSFDLSGIHPQIIINMKKEGII